MIHGLTRHLLPTAIQYAMQRHQTLYPHRQRPTTPSFHAAIQAPHTITTHEGETVPAANLTRYGRVRGQRPRAGVTDACTVGRGFSLGMEPALAKGGRLRGSLSPT